MCRRRDLNSYSPPPRDSSSAPSYGYQRRDQHYQPTHRGESPARPIPQPHARLTPYFQRVTGPFYNLCVHARAGSCDLSGDGAWRPRADAASSTATWKGANARSPFVSLPGEDQARYCAWLTTGVASPSSHSVTNCPAYDPCSSGPIAAGDVDRPSRNRQ